MTNFKKELDEPLKEIKGKTAGKSTRVRQKKNPSVDEQDDTKDMTDKTEDNTDDIADQTEDKTEDVNGESEDITDKNEDITDNKEKVPSGEDNGDETDAVDKEVKRYVAKNLAPGDQKPYFIRDSK